MHRGNLFYEVRPKPADRGALADEVAALITAQWPPSASGIVYCLSRKDCESVAADLCQRRVASAAYHASLDDGARRAAHAAWAAGRVQVIVATVAFGMVRRLPPRTRGRAPCAAGRPPSSAARFWRAGRGSTRWMFDS